jgi:hypothetical protein
LSLVGIALTIVVALTRWNSQSAKVERDAVAA